jgi:hypothetical protein
MTTETVTWISLWLAIAGVVLAGVALFLQFHDKPRLKIIQIHPGISGSRGSGENQWKNNITSIEIVVENKGSRPAVDCEAIITFPHLEALPLYPQTREHLLNIENKIFTVNPKSKVRVVGAWNIEKSGAIGGSKETFTPGEFLEKGTPATIIISFGAKRIRATLTKEEAQKIIENYQAQLYLNDIR